eukprot:3816724-Prymnesium_polylepis.1
MPALASSFAFATFGSCLPSVDSVDSFGPVATPDGEASAACITQSGLNPVIVSPRCRPEESLATL